MPAAPESIAIPGVDGSGNPAPTYASVLSSSPESSSGSTSSLPPTLGVTRRHHYSYIRSEHRRSTDPSVPWFAGDVGPEGEPGQATQGDAAAAVAPEEDDEDEQFMFVESMRRGMEAQRRRRHIDGSLAGPGTISAAPLSTLRRSHSIRETAGTRTRPVRPATRRSEELQPGELENRSQWLASATTNVEAAPARPTLDQGLQMRIRANAPHPAFAALTDELALSPRARSSGEATVYLNGVPIAQEHGAAESEGHEANLDAFERVFFGREGRLRRQVQARVRDALAHTGQDSAMLAAGVAREGESAKEPVLLLSCGGGSEFSGSAGEVLPDGFYFVDEQSECRYPGWDVPGPSRRRFISSSPQADPSDFAAGSPASLFTEATVRPSSLPKLVSSHNADVSQRGQSSWAGHRAAPSADIKHPGGGCGALISARGKRSPNYDLFASITPSFERELPSRVCEMFESDAPPLSDAADWLGILNWPAFEGFLTMEPTDQAPPQRPRDPLLPRRAPRCRCLRASVGCRACGNVVGFCVVQRCLHCKLRVGPGAGTEAVYKHTFYFLGSSVSASVRPAAHGHVKGKRRVLQRDSKEAAESGMEWSRNAAFATGREISEGAWDRLAPSRGQDMQAGLAGDPAVWRESVQDLVQEHRLEAADEDGPDVEPEYSGRHVYAAAPRVPSLRQGPATLDRGASRSPLAHTSSSIFFSPGSGRPLPRPVRPLATHEGERTSAPGTSLLSRTRPAPFFPLSWQDSSAPVQSGNAGLADEAETSFVRTASPRPPRRTAVSDAALARSRAEMAALSELNESFTERIARLRQDLREFVNHPLLAGIPGETDGHGAGMTATQEGTSVPASTRRRRRESEAGGDESDDAEGGIVRPARRRRRDSVREAGADSTGSGGNRHQWQQYQVGLVGR